MNFNGWFLYASDEFFWQMSSMFYPCYLIDVFQCLYYYVYGKYFFIFSTALQCVLCACFCIVISNYIFLHYNRFQLFDSFFIFWLPFMLLLII